VIAIDVNHCKLDELIESLIEVWYWRND